MSARLIARPLSVVARALHLRADDFAVYVRRMRRTDLRLRSLDGNAGRAAIRERDRARLAALRDAAEHAAVDDAEETP